ncbi:MAG: polysaccharide deacetylase family protein [Gemmatimonadales bacterium]
MIRWWIRARRSVEKTLPDLLALAGGTAPRFVYGGHVESIPVFTYHAVDSSFARDLEVLSRGGYRTAGADELAANARGRAASDGRTVALTFDDGDISLLHTAVPLLAKYGFRGIAFVVSGLVPPSTADGLAGWAELRAGVASGVLEVGSHSLYHHQVPVSPKLVGFVDPSTAAHFTANVPIPRGNGYEPAEVGTPIFRGRPRYTARAAFRPDPEAVERCRRFARERGGALFARPGWVRELARLAPRAGTYETASEADAAVVADIRQSLDRIASECPNPAQRHLCYPWYARTARADALAAEAGVALLFGGIGVRDQGSHGKVPPLLRRLPPDLLLRLPGPGRRSLGALLRARGQAIGVSLRGR